MIERNILLGLTTTAKSDWRAKVAEIKELKIKELALLPTMLIPAQRQELYKLLEDSGLESVPYVHMRDDFTLDEINYLVGRYHVKAISFHAEAKSLALIDTLGTLNTIVYLENPSSMAKDTLFTKDTFAHHQVFGLCLDLAHYQIVKDTDPASFKRLVEIMSNYPVDVNHVSAFNPSALSKLFKNIKDEHELKSLHDLNYIKTLSGNCFGKYVVIELENSLLEQQEVVKYLDLVLKSKT